MMKANNLFLALLVIVFFSLFSCGDAPESDFRWEPENPKVGEEVQFINMSENAKRYSWNLGNMSISSEENPVTVYDFEGDFIVDLLAMKGVKSDEKTMIVHIEK